MSEDAMDKAQAGETERQSVVIHAGYELFVVGLLALQLVNSTLLLVLARPEQREIVVEFWFLISLYLMADAAYRFFGSPEKRRTFLAYNGWLTGVGSLPIPFITSLRLGRMAFIVRKLRRGDFKEIGQVIVSRHAQSTMLVVIFAALLIFEFGSITILFAEEDAQAANIATSGDALWWSLVTISTVGYGDRFPTTPYGRLIGMLLIVAGVVLFTSFTSFLSHWFMRPRKTTNEPLGEVSSTDAPQEQIGQIRGLLEEMQASHMDALSELEQRLAQLERSITGWEAESSGPARDVDVRSQ